MKTRPGPRAEKLLIRDLCHWVAKPSGDEYLRYLELMVYKIRRLWAGSRKLILAHWRHHNAVVNCHSSDVNGLEQARTVFILGSTCSWLLSRCVKRNLNLPSELS